ncbi:RING finger protein 10 [Drosophila rhopaloa]|uniref:E3 ubiquitin-protein ligase RNF10 n=1 Tax=Drosophila rhopaloa TaxID=1041015 RepID=A0ABM5H0H8_DRORH|nr:RING finger protein 10 [Drosophila rhopaloa]
MDSNNSSSKKQPQSSHHGKSSSGESQRKSSEVHANSNKQRNSRRREQLPTPRNDQQQQQRSARQQQQQQPQQPPKLRPNVDKRPRARGGGGAYDFPASRGEGGTSGSARLDYPGAGYPRSGEFEHELNSVYAQGSKKQNLNHLLNFHCVPRELQRGHHHQHQQHHGLGIRKQRYNKEQFLQANFQFVIRSGAKAQVNGSPDALIDWSYIEQINIQTTEELQCPICLYPPVAAKLTRCGHAYCWPCLLHYLSLSDKTWRKCPICYDAIHAGDLKSCTIEQRRDLQVGERITFQLMRRRKGSMYIEKHASGLGETIERFPFVTALEEAKRYSKFLIAKRSDVGAIIERERGELLAESDDSCPEDVFIQQALVMLQERREKLGLEQPDPREEEEQPTVLCLEDEIKNDIEKPDDASISSGEASSSLSCSSNNHHKYYYFYQSNDGQNIYLHPLNVKMLQACYGTLDLGPLLIEAQIVQMEQHSMDEEHRRKFTCLGHLPLTCQFSVVEVELQPPIVSGGILKLFKEDILHRKKERQRRAVEERKREQHINEINDRQMGKLIASAANLNLSSSHEFPTFGFEETLPTPSGSVPMTITHQNSGPRYSSVTLASASPKQELWPTIGSGSPGSTAASLDFQAGAWGRSAPPPPPSVLTSKTSDEDFEQRSLGHWGLGELLVGALDQKKQKVEAGKANGAVPAESKKQKKTKGKKMVPLFAMGMNRAP